MTGLAVSGTGLSTILPAVEQRRGSTSQPLEGAGFDPAFIPGLTAPVSGGPEDVRPEKAKPEPAPEADAEAGDDGDAAAAPVAEAAEEPAEEAAEQSGEPEPESESEPDEQEAPDGPVFEAADRRAKIVADHKGVHLALDDQKCEFRWDEVGAVETETGRFGKRFTVTVHTPDRRWYPIEIEAPSRSHFKEWETALDEVLDAYFEDGEAEPEAPPEAEGDAKADAEAGVEADAQAGTEGDAKADTEGDVETDADADADGDGKAKAKPDAKAKAAREE